MITVNYEIYHNDNFREHFVENFPSLISLADWIFNQMRQKYSDNVHAMTIPTPEKADRIHATAPWCISFTPDKCGPEFAIHRIMENGRIIYSDGTYTDGQKHWSKTVREWCTEIEKRRKNPKFDFAE